MKTTKAVFGIITITMALAVQVQAQSFLTNGLIAYYPFNGNANDASGNGYNGTVSGAQLTTDRFGQANAAYHFNGAADQIIVPSTGLSNVAAFTCSGWFLSDSNQTDYSDLVQMDTGGVASRCGFLVRYESGQSQFDFNVEVADVNHYIYTTPPSNASWHQFGLVYDGSATIGFLDGQFVGSVPQAGVFTSQGAQLYIGNWNVSEGFTGKMDDVRFYNRALSTNEVQQLYAYESTPQPIVSLKKAVKPSFANLFLGTNYQLQVSTDLSNWTNTGSPFIPTNSVMDYPQYFDVDDWGQLFFRLQAVQK